MANETPAERLQLLLNEETAATDAAKQAELDNVSSFLDSTEGTYSFIRGVTPQEMEQKLKGRGCFIYVRTDQPYFVSRGSHQVTVDIGGGNVAKFPFGYWMIEIRKTMEMRLPSHIPVGTKGYRNTKDYKNTKEVVDNLREIGFEVPETQFCRFYWDDPDYQLVKVDEKVSHAKRMERASPEAPYPNAMIMPDLRENGRFTIHEYDEDLAKSLKNGSEIYSQFKTGFARLMEHSISSIVGVYDGCPGKKPPYLIVKPHDADYTPETAIRKMFMLQVPTNPKDQGRLVIADFDHVLLFHI